MQLSFLTSPRPPSSPISPAPSSTAWKQLSTRSPIKGYGYRAGPGGADRVDRHGGVVTEPGFTGDARHGDFFKDQRSCTAGIQRLLPRAGDMKACRNHGITRSLNGGFRSDETRRV